MVPKSHISPAADEKGFVLIVVMLFMMILSVIGIAGTHTSNTEVQIAGNERFIQKDFYETESELINAIENYGPWLDDDEFLSAAETLAKYSEPITADLDNDGVDETYTLEVRDITTDTTDVDGLSEYANDIPVDNHIGVASADSGSGTNFKLYRFAVTVRSEDDRTILQAGVYRAFPDTGDE